METENDNKAATAAPARVIVEGDPVDGENAAFRATTPRDVAIQKTRGGEDVGLESSAPIKDEPPVRISPRSTAAGVLIDAAGVEWRRSGKETNKGAVLDPEAIRKDGGDPGTLNIPPHRIGEKYQVENPGNAQYSPNGVLDVETGEVREKTVDEGGIDAGDVNKPEVVANAVKLTAGAGGRTKRASAKKTGAAKSGRGGSGAKARAGGKTRGGAKAKK